MSQIIDPAEFGVSFSTKQCQNLDINPRETLEWLIHQGFRSFRLMSYWDEHEKEPSRYNFTELDWQIKMIAKAGGEISLCLGARQPRWPENHWPDWAWQTSKAKRSEALFKFIEQTVRRYADEESIVTYQLENEALLKSFGRRAEVDRKRLRAEYDLIDKLAPATPILMSTSTTWGIPIRRPIPAGVGFSYYQILYNAKKQKYTKAFHRPWLHRIRALLIKLIHGKPCFVHELQLEPWGPTAIWKMSIEEQAKSMSPAQIAENIKLVRKTKLLPIDLWGGEWWYWRLTKHNDPSIWESVKQAISGNSSN